MLIHFFRAFNQVIMPDQPTLSDDQIKSILSYIEAKSSAPVTTKSGYYTRTSQPENRQ